MRRGTGSWWPAAGSGDGYPVMGPPRVVGVRSPTVEIRWSADRHGARVLRVPTNWFDEPHARRYDRFEAAMFAPERVGPVVDLVAELAGGGAALEFGVGTGRIALPLAERGVPVHGIDLSAAMLAQLRATPGSDRVAVTEGDFATTRVPGAFRVVYLVFNTINNLVTQDAQIAC